MSPFHSYMIARYKKSHFYVCFLFTANATFSHDVVLGSAQSFFSPAAFENAAVQIKTVVVIIAYESSGE